MKPKKLEKLREFRNLKFGMFIHFGLYALGEEHEWHMNRKRMKRQDYAARFVSKFHPTKENIEEWVENAKDLGAKYITVTSKHHDGFCLWNTQIPHPVMPDYHIRSTPFFKQYQTGPLEILYTAAEKAGIRIGIYYSTIDWSFTDKPFLKPQRFIPNNPETLEQYIQYYHAQCHELKLKFPNILNLWFDGYQFRENYPQLLRQKELYDSLSESFPDLLVASNPGVCENYEKYGDVSDYYIIESHGHRKEVKAIVSTHNQKDAIASKTPEYFGELCFNLNCHWGYNAKDKEYKSVDSIIDIVDRMNQQSVNILLNFGPHWDGHILAEQREIAKEIGKQVSSLL